MHDMALLVVSNFLGHLERKGCDGARRSCDDQCIDGSDYRLTLAALVRPQISAPSTVHDLVSLRPNGAAREHDAASEQLTARDACLFGLPFGHRQSNSANGDRVPPHH
jgi:hypothetical protein